MAVFCLNVSQITKKLIISFIQRFLPKSVPAKHVVLTAVFAVFNVLCYGLVQAQIPVFSEEDTVRQTHFNNFTFYQQNRLWGWRNAKAKTVASPLFADFDKPHGKYIAVQDTLGHWGLLSLKGKTKLPFVYDILRAGASEQWIAKKPTENNVKIIDRKGRTLLAGPWQNINQDSNRTFYLAKLQNSVLSLPNAGFSNWLAYHPDGSLWCCDTLVGHIRQASEDFVIVEKQQLLAFVQPGDTAMQHRWRIIEPKTDSSLVLVGYREWQLLDTNHQAIQIVLADTLLGINFQELIISRKNFMVYLLSYFIKSFFSTITYYFTRQ